MAPAELIALLDEFAKAWNRHDGDALVSMMTEDGVFETYAGPEPYGTRHQGRAALRAAFSGLRSISRCELERCPACRQRGSRF